MDNTKPTGPETEFEPKPDTQLEPLPEPADAEPSLVAEPSVDATPSPEAEPGVYVNEKVRQAYDRVKMWFAQVKEYYHRSPRLQKVSYQGKFLPAFWTITAIFSLLVNILLITTLISFGRHFFEVKALLTDGLVNGLSNNLALMDKAHIVTTVPVETTVHLQDNLPVVFDVPLKQNSQVVLTQDTVVDATTYINQALVPLEVTLPAGTPLQLNLDMTIPVSQSVPVDLNVPVSLLVPLDLAIDQTDLHQSIIGLQSTLEPYKVLGSEFNSPKDFPFCTQWWSGWLCNVVFGKP